ncbi:SDR family oxidoreductase [Brevibacterium sp. 'Marine']|uniref:SDR family oxidoreductase n=1 Tax=Brevibacterium sp. 'Marine' TaxID=2725563 RepID=UPI00145D3000|nr:SDR family oxidoreductase [Brevibacterium sp. 'Marine']
MDTFSLAGRRALVTGGSRGLGRAIAQGLVSAGAVTAIASRTATDVESAAWELNAACSDRGRAVPLALDVTRQTPHAIVDEVEAGVDGQLDIVVHAAGVQHRAAAEEFSDDEWSRVLSVNLTAPFRLSQEIGRRQLSSGGEGSHIFIGSIGSVLALPDVSAYTASKSGILGLVRSLSAEWSGRGVRVNGIGPGYFRTALTEAVFADADRSRRMVERIPMGRFGQPEELAGAAIFLASSASSYVTGQMLMVDGGWTST